jgi:hypothetical protein
MEQQQLQTPAQTQLLRTQAHQTMQYLTLAYLGVLALLLVVQQVSTLQKQAAQITTLLG